MKRKFSYDCMHSCKISCESWGLLNFSHDCRFAVGKYYAHSTELCSYLIISFYLQFYFPVVLQLPLSCVVVELITSDYKLQN